MPTEITIHFDDDERDRALITFGELEYRFGADHYVAHRDVEPELDDDETADDIVTILRSMQARMGHSNGSMRVIDTLIEMASAEAPPALEPRPTPQHVRDRSNQAIQGSGAKVLGLEQVPCQTCGAPEGMTCRTGSGARYYPGWGHQARIDLVAPGRLRPDQRRRQRVQS